MTAPVPFDEELFEKGLSAKINIGYCYSLQTTPATAAMRRGIDIAKNALESLGYTMVAVSFTDQEINDARDIVQSMTTNYVHDPAFKTLDANYEEPCESVVRNRNIVDTP